MAKKRIKTVNISITPGTFNYIFKRFRGQVSDYEFSELAELRQVLSNEKARLLYTIKHENPSSIYHLAKLLKREFKSVLQDAKILEKFGFIELKKELKGNRKMLKPSLAIDSLQVNFEV